MAMVFIVWVWSVFESFIKWALPSEVATISIEYPLIKASAVMSLFLLRSSGNLISINNLEYS